MLVWYGVRAPAGLCVVAAGRMFGHAWMALEPRGATGAECPGAVPGGDGGYLGGAGWRPVSWHETTYRPDEKGPVTPQVAHLSVIIPKPEDNGSSDPLIIGNEVSVNYWAGLGILPGQSLCPLSQNRVHKWSVVP